MFKKFKILRYLFWILISIFVLEVGLSIFVHFKKDYLKEQIIEWYDKNRSGELSLGEVSVSVFKHFPRISVVFNDVKIQDSVASRRTLQALSAQELSVGLSIGKLIRGHLALDRFTLKHGQMYVYKDSTEVDNSYLFYLNNTKTLKTTEEPKEPKKKVTVENGKIQIIDFQLLIEDMQKNKRFDLTFNRVTSFFKDFEDYMQFNAKIDITANEVGFNLKNGSFFTGARLRGSFFPRLHKEEQMLTIDHFVMQINEQSFHVQSKFDLAENTFFFEIENEAAIWAETVPLLSNNITRILNKFALSQPVNAHGIIQGDFAYKSIPLVDINFHTDNNHLVINDSLTMDEVFASGRFVNKYYWENVKSNEDKVNFKLYLDEFDGIYSDIPFSINNSYFANYDDVNDAINLCLDLGGSPGDLNTIFNTEDFIFQKKGKFEVQSFVDGRFENLHNILRSTNTKFTLDDASLYYRPLNLIVPIKKIDLDVSQNNAILNSFELPLGPNDHTMVFDGKIKNLTALAFGEDAPVQSELEIHADSLTYQDIRSVFNVLNQQDSLDLANNNELKEKPKKEPQQLNTREQNNVTNAAIKDIYKVFQPKFKFLVRNFFYDDFQLQDVSTEFAFNDQNHIELRNTGFNYRNGFIRLDFAFDIEIPGITPFDMKLDAKDLDLGQFVADFDYFNVEDLKNTDKLEGVLDLDGTLKGTILGTDKLANNSLEGKLSFNLDKLEVSNFQPIIEVASKVFRKKRWLDIKFAPITNTITLKNERIYIPKMEIQSTAFQLYVEGVLSNIDYDTNLWISVPLNNLNRRNYKEAPRKSGLNNPYRKVYVQATDKTGKMKYNFKLNNKQQYIDRGIEDQYKIDKLEQRKERLARYRKNHPTQ